MRKILIYGGAFDPPHYGHLAVAQTALEVMSPKGFNHLWFMPCASDTFGMKALAGGSHRVSMLEMIALAESRASISTFELDMNNQAGTYALMKALMQTYPGTDFAYVIGQDQARQIKKWRNSRALRKLVPFVTIRRLSEPPFRWAVRWAENAPHVFVKDSPMEKNMASSEIRRAISAGHTKYMRNTVTSPAVMSYIHSNNLYKSEGKSSNNLYKSEDKSDEYTLGT